MTLSRLDSAREYALKLVNQARSSAGLNEVILDDNTAAQSHAEDMRENCFLSQWGSNGSKHYMRYTQAGGQQNPTQVINGYGYCPDDPSRYRQKTINEEIEEAVDDLLGSSGTRTNVLDPRHRKVNIGISYRRPNIWLVLMFVGDYIDYTEAPSIQDGTLRLAGKVKNGARLDTGEFDVVVEFDPLPRSLTRGQIHNSDCYTSGLPVAALNPPDPYSTFSTTVMECDGPHSVPPDAPAAQSYQDDGPQITPVKTERDVPLVDTQQWSIEDVSFSIEADLTEAIRQHGIGVYTVTLWGDINGEGALLSEHSIFVTTLPPPPTPTATLTPTPTTPSGLSEDELKISREYALKLINDARTATGLNPVTFDDNSAAQSHAEDMRENCTLSHWGTDGLKPYMRYTLVGGQHYSAENVSGIGYCPPEPGRYIAKSITEEIDEAMDGLLNSPGHRQNILDPHHRQVNIGISYQRPNLWLVQLFVGDYVQYTRTPVIENGVLYATGLVKNGTRVDDGRLDVTIKYDRTPHPLTRGQLHHTGCYSGGQPIAALNPFDAYSWFSSSGTNCDDPYSVPADASPAKSYDDDKPSISQTSYEHEVALVVPQNWFTTRDSFEFTADISDLLNQHGDGVYTIVLWGEINGEDVPISEYSIFVPPRP